MLVHSIQLCYRRRYEGERQLANVRRYMAAFHAFQHHLLTLSGSGGNLASEVFWHLHLSHYSSLRNGGGELASLR